MRAADEPLTGASQIGTRVHAALEAWYGYGIDPVAAVMALYNAACRDHPDWSNDLNSEREMAVVMITGYLEWVAETGKDAGLTVVATERDVRVPLPGIKGVELRAKLDQVVYDEQTGLLSFLDHKTAMNFDKHTLLALDPQFKLYALIQALAKASDAPLVDGGFLNTLRRVKRTSKSQPPYYQRDPFRYTPAQIEATLRGVRHLVTEIIDARYQLDYARDHDGNELAVVNALQQSVLYPSPMLKQCGWDCPFVNLCPMMDDGSDWTGVLLRSGHYVQGDPYSYYDQDPISVIKAELAAL
jgi:hypothetical protein